MDTNYPVVITVDGNTYNFTQDSLADYIKHAETDKKTVPSLQKDLSHALRVIHTTRQTVYSFFKRHHTTGDIALEIEVSDINEMLDVIDADKLCNLYNATITVTVAVEDIEAIDEDDVVQIIKDELQVDIGSHHITIEQIDVNEVQEL